MSRELLKRALEALTDAREVIGFDEYVVADIETYLAQPEPEPVAWMWTDGLEVYFENSGDPDHNWVPLYTTPPDQSARIAELETDWRMKVSKIIQLEQQLAALQAQRDELLAALKHMLGTLLDGPDESDVAYTINKARTAIAKAKGEV